MSYTATRSDRVNGRIPHGASKAPAPKVIKRATVSRPWSIIWRARTAAGLSQARLGEHVGMNQSELSRLERTSAPAALERRVWSACRERFMSENRDEIVPPELVSFEELKTSTEYYARLKAQEGGSKTPGATRAPRRTRVVAQPKVDRPVPTPVEEPQSSDGVAVETFEQAPVTVGSAAPAPERRRVTVDALRAALAVADQFGGTHETVVTITHGENVVEFVVEGLLD